MASEGLRAIPCHLTVKVNELAPNPFSKENTWKIIPECQNTMKPMSALFFHSKFVAFELEAWTGWRAGQEGWRRVRDNSSWQASFMNKP